MLVNCKVKSVSFSKPKTAVITRLELQCESVSTVMFFFIQMIDCCGGVGNRICPVKFSGINEEGFTCSLPKENTYREIQKSHFQQRFRTQYQLQIASLNLQKHLTAKLFAGPNAQTRSVEDSISSHRLSSSCRNFL
ncbi:hypothetical protein CDAR_77161 [Caerostris darwini]|uniref:Uncharacterized protein n=1 Tax=Caerostris darwini TaxID=1538125 RepID=A0AAV4SPX6_9ARAC|nr:hypothetical protein CDAR_77161 [Caerostris darwini]